MNTTQKSAWTDISLVAGREISTRVRAKSFAIGTVLSLLFIVGLVIVVAAASGGSDDGPEPTTIAQFGVSPEVQASIVSSGEQLGLTVKFTGATADAREKASAGDVDAALVREGDGYRIYSPGDTLDREVEAALRAGVSDAAITGALREAGTDPAVTTPPPIDFRTAVQPEPVDPDRDDRMLTATVGVMLLILTVFGGGMAVAAGIIEEKTSRIVEILLATIKPARLLWGKILGIGVVMIGSTLLTAAVGLVAAVATGLVGSFAVAGTVIAASLIWLVLGFLFYAVLYAATGAMLSRQEELNSTTWPLTAAALGTFYAVLFGAGTPDSTLFQWLAWIPPFSAGIQPLRIADGSASVFEIVGSIAVMVVVTALAVAAAGRIYQRSVLNVGARVGWREALGLGATEKGATA